MDTLSRLWLPIIAYEVPACGKFRGPLSHLLAQNVSIGTTIVLLLDIDALELTVTVDDRPPMICPLVQDQLQYPVYPIFCLLEPSSSFQVLPDLCF